MYTSNQCCNIFCHFCFLIKSNTSEKNITCSITKMSNICMLLYTRILTKYMPCVCVFFFLLVTSTFKRLTVFHDLKKYTFRTVVFGGLFSRAQYMQFSSVYVQRSNYTMIIHVTWIKKPKIQNWTALYDYRRHWIA